jgi:site-specific recombinase XerD
MNAEIIPKDAGMSEYCSTNVIKAKLASYADEAVGAFSTATHRAIRSDTRQFLSWCRRNHYNPMPATPDIIRIYIDEHSSLHRPATVRRRVSSIAHLHRACGLDDPTASNTVRLAVRRMNRMYGRRQRQARPLTETDVAVILASMGDTLVDLRDKTLLLTARDLLARRSELVDLNTADIEFNDDGSAVAIIRRSKTDQEGEGAHRWLSHRTVTVMRSWLDKCHKERGCLANTSFDCPLFVSVRKGDRLTDKRLAAGDVARRLKVMAQRANIDAEFVSGHSCRIGMAQDLVAVGVELPALMQAGRWKSAEMPSRYTERLAAGRGAVARYYSVRGEFK